MALITGHIKRHSNAILLCIFRQKSWILNGKVVSCVKVIEHLVFNHYDANI